MKKKRLFFLVVMGVFFLTILYFFISQYYFKDREISGMELRSVSTVGSPTPEFIEAVEKAVKESKNKK